MGTRRIMMTGKTVGMTLSGVSPQTTAGNTIREIMKAKFFKYKLGARSDQYQTLHAGDDTLLMISRKLLTQQLDLFSQYFSPIQDPIPHGIGFQVKELTISDTYADFLSKDILVTADTTLVARKPERVYQGGQLSTKLTKELTPEIFNYGIT